MNILVTGGLGYIGSHTVKELLNNSFYPVVYDNLSNGIKEAFIGGDFVYGDLSNKEQIRYCFEKYNINAVIHFASSILVEESVSNPLKYYKNNMINGINLLEIMLEYNVKKIIFSSSAAVYGEPQEIPITESNPIFPINPYGKTKAIFENILEDFDRAYGLKYIILRYFNAAGADPNGLLGENHNPETHLIPKILKKCLYDNVIVNVYGTDYPTQDGTCIRDYIHVTDIARAHVLALNKLNNDMNSSIFNIGSGIGYSVREVIQTIESVTGKKIKIVESEKRFGDPAILLASTEKINKELGWKSKFGDLYTIIKTAWDWFQKHNK